MTRWVGVVGLVSLHDMVLKRLKMWQVNDRQTSRQTHFDKKISAESLTQVS